MDCPKQQPANKKATKKKARTCSDDELYEAYDEDFFEECDDENVVASIVDNYNDLKTTSCLVASILNE